MSQESIQSEECVSVAAGGLGGQGAVLGAMAAELAGGCVRAAVQPAMDGFVGMIQGWIRPGCWLGFGAEA